MRAINWGNEDLVNIQKNFYVEDDAVRNMTEEEVTQYRAQEGIKNKYIFLVFKLAIIIPMWRSLGGGMNISTDSGHQSVDCEL